ncbi:MAG: alpha/beta fold hydrolase [Akkermansiaceae bacterium]|nr:alpha/beta fold hydrolase [Armatimonadota bacterium]
MQPSNTLSLTHLTRPPRIAPPDGGKPPLLILLHGVGSHERDLFGLANELDGRFFVVSVRAPLPHGGGFGWYPVDFTPNGPVADEAKARTSRDLLQTFIGEITQAYGLDSDRVYLAGFSQGAIMSLYLALHSPELVAGVAAMSGRLIEATLSERAEDARLAGLPILAVHGVYDRVLTIAEGRRIQAELSRLPVELTYHEYEMAHEVSRESLGAVASFLTARLDSSGKP